MSRGKQAAAAANRRADAAEAENASLKERLADEKARAGAEEKRLKDEIGRLKNGLIEEAGRLAAEEVRRLNEEIIQLRAAVREGNELNRQEARARDYLMRTMSKYISMTEGEQPSVAVGRVITWLTSERFDHGTDVDKTIKQLSLPADGWVASELRRGHGYLSAEALQGHLAVSLDEAEENPGSFNVHPAYLPAWYEKQKPPRLDGRGGSVFQAQRTTIRITDLRKGYSAAAEKEEEATT